MNPNKALWEKGDFTRIARGMRASGDELVKKFGIERGMEILELGCGDGTTAIPAAQRGAKVRGVDIARNLVEAGNRRAREFSLPHCTFEEGDACSLENVASRSADLVVSIFGAMFAPKPFDVAREMVRVARPGGRIIMGNWIAGDPTIVAQILKVSAAYTPPPPEGFVSPMTWGVEAHVLERFEKAGISPDRVKCERDTFVFCYEGSPREVVSDFKNYYGPTMSAFEAAAQNGRDAELERELVQLFESQNRAAPGDGTVTPATFLRVTVQV
jgi:SAM-dependent methyltransferase